MGIVEGEEEVTPEARRRFPARAPSHKSMQDLCEDMGVLASALCLLASISSHLWWVTGQGELWHLAKKFRAGALGPIPPPPALRS